MKTLENCTEVAKAKITTPSEPIMRRVLRENGFSGSVGLNFLSQNYGKVFSNVNSDLLMFCGIHIGRNVELMSYGKLQWNHRVVRQPMCAGFFRREEMIEHTRFQNLMTKLGADIEVDVVGCIGSRKMCNVIETAASNPPATWWIGVCERGWLAIDLDYFLLDVYESISALLCEQNAIELIAED